MDPNHAEFRFVCSLENGVHARPASLLADVARPFASEITITRDGGPTVSLTSVLSVIGLDIKKGDHCSIEARGHDASQAIRAIGEFVMSRLAVEDEVPSPRSRDAAHDPKVPITLRRMNLIIIPGRSVSGGFGTGDAVVISESSTPLETQARSPADAADEWRRVQEALIHVKSDLSRRAAAASGLEADLLNAHAAIAQDRELCAEIERRVRAGASAIDAVAGASDCFANRLSSAKSAYIRERAVDVRDVCGLITDQLQGPTTSRVPSLTRDSIVFAETLTPNQLLKLDRTFLKGLVLGSVGQTSHTVILARSMAIPTLIGVARAAAIAKVGEQAIVDGDGGYVIPEAHPPALRYFARERAAHARRRERLLPLASVPAATSDGLRLEVGVNASTAQDVAAAIPSGADGVGLLRTELLFLDRDTPPSEDEQFLAYRDILHAAAGRPVIIRTFDIGGDKPASYMPLPPEENPFLGVRGLRLYERFPEMLRTQVRAILRASAFGTIKIMAPMVSLPREAAWFRDQVLSVRDELDASSTPHDRSVPIGLMIEVPSAAFAIPELSEIVDFFSIGTNDLCQYFLAADRGNPGVSRLYDAGTPSFLRLLKQIADAAKSRGKWVGICGEMAGDRTNLPILIGLGVDEISLAPSAVMETKAAVHGLNAATCRELLDTSLSCGDPVEVDSVLSRFAERADSRLPVIDAALIEPRSDAISKEEAIKSAVDLLYISGRTTNPGVIEEAAWAREETYSTGLGHGFAVPHCKSAAVSAPALSVVKVSTPVDWGSMDGLPVSVVMLLVVPSNDTKGSHMKVFARLARRLMHEDFRSEIQRDSSPDRIAAFLRRELEV